MAFALHVSLLQQLFSKLCDRRLARFFHPASTVSTSVQWGSIVAFGGRGNNYFVAPSRADSKSGAAAVASLDASAIWSARSPDKSPLRYFPKPSHAVVAAAAAGV